MNLSWILVSTNQLYKGYLGEVGEWNMEYGLIFKRHKTFWLEKVNILTKNLSGKGNLQNIMHNMIFLQNLSIFSGEG